MVFIAGSLLLRHAPETFNIGRETARVAEETA